MRKRRDLQDRTGNISPCLLHGRMKERRNTGSRRSVYKVQPRSKNTISSLLFFTALTSKAIDLQQARAEQRHMRLLGVEDSGQDAEDEDQRQENPTTCELSTVFPVGGALSHRVRLYGSALLHLKGVDIAGHVLLGLGLFPDWLEGGHGAGTARAGDAAPGAAAAAVDGGLLCGVYGVRARMGLIMKKCAQMCVKGHDETAGVDCMCCGTS